MILRDGTTALSHDAIPIVLEFLSCNSEAEQNIARFQEPSQNCHLGKEISSDSRHENRFLRSASIRLPLLNPCSGSHPNNDGRLTIVIGDLLDLSPRKYVLAPSGYCLFIAQRRQFEAGFKGRWAGIRVLEPIRRGQTAANSICIFC
jgi:hypothetical protein